MWTKRFWKDAAERIISSAAWAASGVIGSSVLVQHLDWRIVAGTAGTAGLLSFLKALYARTSGDPESASLVQ